MWRIKKILSLIIILIFFSTPTHAIITQINYQTFNDMAIYQEKKCLLNKTYYAILVGINDYPGVELDLPYSINEITSFKNTLLLGTNWEQSNIKVLTDTNATASNIIQKIRWLDEQENENDISIFYYAGHGGKTNTNEYLITYDSLLSDVELAQELDKLEGKVVVILDSCYSGGFIEELENRNRVILAACAKNGIAFQDSRLKSGFFGYFLNLSLEKFTNTAEMTFLFACPLTILYTKWLSDKIGKNLSIRPRISDKSIALTRILYRPFFLHRLTKINDAFESYQKEASNEIWIL